MKAYINDIFDISIRNKYIPKPVKNKANPIPNEKLVFLDTISNRQQNGINIINKKPLDNVMEIEEENKFDPFDFPHDDKKPPQKYSSNNDEILKLKDKHNEEMLNLKDINNNIREEFDTKYDELLNEYNKIKSNLERQTSNYNRLLNTNKGLETDNLKILQDYDHVSNINNELKLNLDNYKNQINNLDTKSKSDQQEKQSLLTEIENLNKLLVLKEKEFNINVKANYEQQIISLKNELNAINEKNKQLHNMNNQQLEIFNKSKLNLMNKINEFKNVSLSMKKMHIDLKSSVRNDLNNLMNLTYEDINKLSLNSKKLLNENNGNYKKSMNDLKQNYELTLQQLKNEYNSALHDLTNKNNTKDKIIQDKDSLLQHLRDEYNRTISDLQNKSLAEITQKEGLLLAQNNSYKLLDDKLKSLEKDLINKDNYINNMKNNFDSSNKKKEEYINQFINEYNNNIKLKDESMNDLLKQYNKNINERDNLINDMKTKSISDKTEKENNIKLLNDKISELENKYHEIITEKNNLFNQYSQAIDNNLKDYSKEIENKDAIIKDLQNKFIEMQNKNLFDIDQIQTNNNYLKSELLSKEQIINQLDDNLNELNEIITNKMYSQEQFEKIENEKNLFIQSLKNEYENNFNELQQMIANKDTTIEDLVSKIKQLENDIYSLKALLGNEKEISNKLKILIKSVKGLEEDIISKLSNVTPQNFDDYGDIDRIPIEKSPVHYETTRFPNTTLEDKIEEEKEIPPQMQIKPITKLPPKTPRKTPQTKINLHNYITPKSEKFVSPSSSIKNTPPPLTESEILNEEIKDYGKTNQIHIHFLQMLIYLPLLYSNYLNSD